MGPIEAATRKSLEKAHAMARDNRVDPANPILHLALIAGTMEAFVAKMESQRSVPDREESDDVLNTLYAILGDYEQQRLEKELNGD